MADKAKEKMGSSSPDTNGDSFNEKRKQSVFDVDASGRENLNAVFENPLASVPDDQLMSDVEKFCQEYDLMDDFEDMKKGALLSKYPGQLDSLDCLDEEEKEVVRREKTHKWDHPWMLYWLCSEYQSSTYPLWESRLIRSQLCVR